MNDPRRAASQLRRELSQARHDPDHGVRFEPDRVLTTLRAVTGQPETAVALLAEVWPAIPTDTDPAWLQALCEAGTEPAAALPTSLLSAVAFRRAAHTLRTRGLLRLAAHQGMRELAVHRVRDDDPGATAAALHDLARTYRAQGRLHKVIDCADETLETHQRHHNQPSTAHTLAHLGTLMIEVGRHDSAVKYLTRADKALEQLPDPIRRAECLVDLGRALWLSGNHTTAHRAFNRALAVAIGLDDAVAHRIRDAVTEARQTPSIADAD
ncbi:tetratricopeptide repeat protein [Saccharothrix carnea]|uniref:Tetratricopeptide repeat protein n=1 Tax=Saccharothrix carnea TaxID=1280637 RepID=A0A2P8HYZ2_SACCR|nr:tetratricopeptide repeat protein [Saccharothrix carnea]PSL51413.1 tetratricopeptide repeat protein [Saccharothrix carnea]